MIERLDRPDLEPIRPWDEERREYAQKLLWNARKHIGSYRPANAPVHDALDEFEQILFEVERLKPVADELPEIHQRLRDVEGTMRLIARVSPAARDDDGTRGEARR